jgi:hypothetical protein
MATHSLRQIGAALLLMLAATSGPAAQMFITTGKDTLRSLPGVELIVEPLQPELERAGLTARAVRAGVERQLRASRVPLFASQASNTSAAKPYLYVNLNAVEVPGQTLYAIAVQIQIRQTVRSAVTSSNIVDAVTWDSHTVVLAPAKQLASIHEEIAEHVDLFVKDWVAVH